MYIKFNYFSLPETPHFLFLGVYLLLKDPKYVMSGKYYIANNWKRKQDSQQFWFCTPERSELWIKQRFTLLSYHRHPYKINKFIAIVPLSICVLSQWNVGLNFIEVELNLKHPVFHHSERDRAKWCRSTIKWLSRKSKRTLLSSFVLFYCWKKIFSTPGQPKCFQIQNKYQ